MYTYLYMGECYGPPTHIIEELLGLTPTIDRSQEKLSLAAALRCSSLSSLDSLHRVAHTCSYFLSIDTIGITAPFQVFQDANNMPLTLGHPRHGPKSTGWEA